VLRDVIPLDPHVELLVQPNGWDPIVRVAEDQQPHPLSLMQGEHAAMHGPVLSMDIEEALARAEQGEDDDDDSSSSDSNSSDNSDNDSEQLDLSVLGGSRVRQHKRDEQQEQVQEQLQAALPRPSDPSLWSPITLPAAPSAITNLVSTLHARLRMMLPRQPTPSALMGLVEAHQKQVMGLLLDSHLQAVAAGTASPQKQTFALISAAALPRRPSPRHQAKLVAVMLEQQREQLQANLGNHLQGPGAAAQAAEGGRPAAVAPRMSSALAHTLQGATTTSSSSRQVAHGIMTLQQPVMAGQPTHRIVGVDKDGIHMVSVAPLLVRSPLDNSLLLAEAETHTTIVPMQRRNSHPWFRQDAVTVLLVSGILGCCAALAAMHLLVVTRCWRQQQLLSDLEASGMTQPLLEGKAAGGPGGGAVTGLSHEEALAAAAKLPVH
jgi:hypothetical protein